MKNKSNRWLSLGVILVLVYLFVDILHYFMYRKSPDYLLFSEAFYENRVISFVKWFFCIIMIVSIVLKGKTKVVHYLNINVSIGILMLFILKGQLTNMLLGSIAFKFGILEIGSLIILINYIIELKNRYSLKYTHFIIFIFIPGLILSFILNQLPVI